MTDNEQTEIAVLEPVSTSPLDALTRDFSRDLKRRNKNRELFIGWIRDSLVAGTDFMRVKTKRYGWSKPFLTKSGAEKVQGMLGVRPTFPNLQEQTDALSAGKSTIMIIRCDMIDQAGNVVSSGAGGRTLEQDDGDINKMIKMALKSSAIDATLRLGGLSQIFTQDEESAHDDDIEHTISDKQVAVLTKAATEVGLKVENVCKFYGIKELSELPVSSFLRAKKAIEKKRGESDETGR